MKLGGSVVLHCTQSSSPPADSQSTIQCQQNSKPQSKIQPKPLSFIHFSIWLGVLYKVSHRINKSGHHFLSTLYPKVPESQ